MPVAEVEVRGLRELQAAFARMGSDFRREMREELLRVATPVRIRAENLASEKIRNIGQRWGRMRVGVTSTLVYVAPQSHRAGGSPRANLAPLLMDRAMSPALDESEEEIVHRFGQLIENVADFNGF